MYNLSLLLLPVIVCILSYSILSLERSLSVDLLLSINSEIVCFILKMKSNQMQFAVEILWLIFWTLRLLLML